jgi:hypothetical protein
MNRNLALLGFAGRQRTESLHRVESNGRAGRTQGRHRRFIAQRTNHAPRHLDSTTVHLYVEKPLDLAGAGLNGWQQGQRMGVQVINVSPGASHLVFAQVVA